MIKYHLIARGITPPDTDGIFYSAPLQFYNQNCV